MTTGMCFINSSLQRDSIVAEVPWCSIRGRCTQWLHSRGVRACAGRRRDCPELWGKITSRSRTLIVQVLPENRLGWIQAAVDDVHEQALVGAFRLCE
jgi:hypothetical protein